MIVFLILYSHCLLAQHTAEDSATVMEEIQITGYEQNSSLLVSGFSAGVISKKNIGQTNKSSLLQDLNSLPGVRMEERSPGSYRLAIRGSSLRSAFGVRNVKVYWNNIPATDASGNTYFNQFSVNNFSGIEILKGPAGSMYGSGTGGAVLLHSVDAGQPVMEAEYNSGSYGLQQLYASAALRFKKDTGIINFSHSQSTGYRYHSSITRNNFSWVSKSNISKTQQLTASFLINNVSYQTPGALTRVEYENNPAASRPSTANLPSAGEAKAAVYQLTILSGITHQVQFDKFFSLTGSLFVSYASIKNPAIRNYEKRTEPNYGGRAIANWAKERNGIHIKLSAGGEIQSGIFNTRLYKNENGNPGSLQADNRIVYNTWFAFVQANVSFQNKLFVTIGGSANKSAVAFSDNRDSEGGSDKKDYQIELAPRFNILYKIGRNISVFSSVSKGFSPPTVSELLPSTGIVSKTLEAETAINWEAGSRWYLAGNKLWVEMLVYYLQLQNAIAVRRDQAGADYFINAGSTHQKGVEASMVYKKIFLSGWVSKMHCNASFAWQHYKYGAFVKDVVPLDGKTLPGIPGATWSVFTKFETKMGVYASVNYYHAASLFLNDINTDKASAYHLLGFKTGYVIKRLHKPSWHFYLGADNLLNVRYSLGNDINATNGRYFNAAAKRNFYLGIGFQM